MKKTNKLFLLLVVMILLGLIGWRISQHYHVDSTDHLDNEAKVYPVTALQLTPVDFKDHLEVMGTIKGEQSVNLTFEKSGQIQEFYVLEGQVCQKGDPLVSLINKEAALKLKYAEAKVEEAQVNVAIASKKFNHLKALFDLGGIAQNRVDEERLALLKAEKELQTARVDRDYQKEILEGSTIKAPFDGVFLEKGVEAGEVVTPNTLIGKFSQVDHVYAEIGIIERDLAKVNFEQIATLTVDSYPNETFQGYVDVIAPVVSGDSRTMTLKIKIPNEKGRLLPGMYANGSLTVVEMDQVIVVPKQAVFNNQDGSFVYKLLDKTSAQQTFIEVAYQNHEFVVVKKGLSDQDFVVLKGLGPHDPEQVEVDVKELNELNANNKTVKP